MQYTWVVNILSFALRLNIKHLTRYPVILVYARLASLPVSCLLRTCNHVIAWNIANMEPVWSMYGVCLVHVWSLFDPCMEPVWFHVWNLIRPCMEPVWVMYTWSLFGSMYGTWLGHVWNLFGPCMEPVWTMYGTCLGHVWNLSGPCMEPVWAMYGTCLGHVYWTCNIFSFLQQWATFARQWWVYDAKWQCPFRSAPVVIRYLQGKHKPIYHPCSKSSTWLLVMWYFVIYSEQ